MEEYQQKEPSVEHDYLELTDPEEYKDHVGLEELNERQKKQRMVFLWKKAFAKAKGAMIIINRF